MIEKLNIFTALKEGYRFHLESDGVAEVVTPDGATYGVDMHLGDRGTCTCADFQHRRGSYGGACKHMWWVAQLTLCPQCGYLMIEVDAFYGCTNDACQAFRSSEWVNEQRVHLRAGHGKEVA